MSDASLGPTRGPLVGRPEVGKPPWARIVCCDYEARTLRQMTELDPDRILNDTPSSGKYRKHWSPGPGAYYIDGTSMVLDDVYETFGWAPIRIKLRKDARRAVIA